MHSKTMILGNELNFALRFLARAEVDNNQPKCIFWTDEIHFMISITMSNKD